MIKFEKGNLMVPKWTRPVYMVAAGTTDFRKRYPEKKLDELAMMAFRMLLEENDLKMDPLEVKGLINFCCYGEFADHLGERMFDLVERGDTVVLRTFSKAYGLAGMRVGWGLFPPAIAAETRKVMNPNNVALPGQMAAHAALLDHDYMRETCAQTAVLRDAFATRLRAAGFQVRAVY